MATQLSLFGDNRPANAAPQGTMEAVRANAVQVAAQIAAMTRRDGAETSRLAAERMVASGRLESNLSKTLAALVLNPATTYTEVAEAAGLEKHEAMKRLNDLAKRGLAHKYDSESRICTIGGTKCSVWRATVNGDDLVEAHS